VSAFFDAGTAYDVGGRLDKAEWHRGVGGGVFLIASVFRLNLDVARGLKTDDTRLHLGVGFPF
jgi:outer membrane translocation and assembly module TamA